MKEESPTHSRREVCFDNKINLNVGNGIINLLEHLLLPKVQIFILRRGMSNLLKSLRATPAGRANGLLYEDLVGGHQKSISSRGSKMAAILVGLPNPPLIW